jgi:hypothetical protein
MRLMILGASMFLASVACAEDQPGPTGGTFAGQQPRGQSVSAGVQKYNDAGSNYGQSWAQPRTEEAHGQPGPGSEVANDIQGHIAQTDPVQGPEIVGYGRNK